MKHRTILVAAVLIGTAGPAVAASRQDNYRDCSIHHLERCDDSNELFFGPNDEKGRPTAKPEFLQTLTRFLYGAPKRYAGTITFTPAQAAQELLVGPGDHHDHLPTGEWLFDGFTPHYASDKGAVIFNSAGDILSVALLDKSTETSGRPEMGRYNLSIYCHGELGSVLMEKLQEWARSQINPKPDYPGFPPNVLGETKFYSLVGKSWTVRSLP